MNLRDIKKDIDYVLGYFIEDCAACIDFNPKVNDEAIVGLMEEAVDLYNELRDKVMVRKVEGTKKAYFNALRKEVLERTDALYAKLSETIVKGEKPVEEKKTPAKKTAPKAEEKPAEEKKAPVKKAAPKAEEKTDAAKKAPAKKVEAEEKPVAEKKPAAKKAPAKKAEAEEKPVAEKKAPAKKTAPKAEEKPEAEEKPAAKKAPAKKAEPKAE